MCENCGLVGVSLALAPAVSLMLPRHPPIGSPAYALGGICVGVGYAWGGRYATTGACAATLAIPGAWYLADHAGAVQKKLVSLVASLGLVASSLSAGQEDAAAAMVFAACGSLATVKRARERSEDTVEDDDDGGGWPPSHQRGGSLELLLWCLAAGAQAVPWAARGILVAMALVLCSMCVG